MYMSASVCVCSDTHWKQNSSSRLEILPGEQKKQQVDSALALLFALSCLQLLSGVRDWLQLQTHVRARSRTFASVQVALTRSCSLLHVRLGYSCSHTLASHTVAHTHSPRIQLLSDVYTRVQPLSHVHTRHSANSLTHSTHALSTSHSLAVCEFSCVVLLLVSLAVLSVCLVIFRFESL